MTNSLISPIEEINAALVNYNPFAKPAVVGRQEVWRKELPDVKSLNAHASDAVFQAINQIREGLYPRTSIAITAESGTGKTHIISRIRHRLQTEGGALFIYATEFSDLDNIKSGFLATLGDSLREIGSQGVMQWQELAAEIVNQAVKLIQPNAKRHLPKDVAKILDNNDLNKARGIVNKLTDTFRKTKSNLKNPDIIKAILWTLIDSEALYAVKWLSGEELAQYKANELCLPSSIGKPFDATQQILDLISDYNQLVICFDELDLPLCNKAGLTKALVVAGLVKELFENLSRGVILTVTMPAIWSNKIKQLPAGVYSKVSAQGNPIDLKYMNEDSIVELVALWLKEFYESRNLVPPHQLYPFTETQLRELSSEEKPPVRKVLDWCKNNCKAAVGKGDKDENNPVEEAFKKELAEDISGYLDNNLHIADALLFGFQSLIGHTVEKVTIKQVTERLTTKAKKDKHINFKIIGEQDGKDVIIGVAVLQNPSGQALGYGLRKLHDFDSFGLTRGCLVRSKSKDKEISKYLHKTYINPLVSKGGEFVALKEEEIKSLIAIRSVHKKCNIDYGLTEEEIVKFILKESAKNNLGKNNPLLQEILSDPSYIIPDDVIEEEIDIFNHNITSEFTVSADLSELVMVD